MDEVLKPITVALPLGIGDCHWVVTKLRSLSQYHGGAPIHVYVASSPDHRSAGYLEMVPFVEKATYASDSLYDINGLRPNYRSPHWSHLRSCSPWRQFDYCLQANGHLEEGNHLSTYLPELETDWSYPLNIPQYAEQRAEVLGGKGKVLLYPSGRGPNTGFHNNTWTMQNWAEVVRRLNAEDVVPVLIGAATESDISYRDVLTSWLGGLKYVDIIGHTDLPTVCALLKDASAWCGLNSGLGILAGMMSTPTVMMWSDNRYQIQGVHQYLHPNMQTSWLNEEQLRTYRTFSYGSETLTPENVVASILSVMR